MSRRFLILMALSLVALLPVAGQRKGKTSAKTPAKTATTTTVKKTAAEVNTTTVEALLEDYRFTEAARLLERDLQQAARTAQPTTQLEERLRRVRLGADMLRGTEKVTFVDSVVVPKKNFLRAYRLSRSQGTLAPLAELIPALGTNVRAGKWPTATSGATVSCLPLPIVPGGGNSSPPTAWETPGVLLPY